MSDVLMMLLFVNVLVISVCTACIDDYTKLHNNKKTNYSAY